MSKEIQTLDLIKIKDIAVEKNRKEKTDKGVLHRKTCIEILEAVKISKDLSNIEAAAVMVTGLVQRGGSNRNAGPNATYELNGKTLNANELQNIIHRIDKSATIRQFCRAMANDIADIAMIIEEEGDLAKQMKIQHSDLSMEEAAWCSNFQTKNPRCPKRTKEWLVENYNKRFRN